MAAWVCCAMATKSWFLTAEQQFQIAVARRQRYALKIRGWRGDFSS